MAYYSKFESKRILKGKIVFETDFHIGSGDASEKPWDVDSPVIKTEISGKEVPFIPGSSLKGAFRNYAESLLRGLGKKVCDLNSKKAREYGETDASKGRCSINDWRKHNAAISDDELYNGLCDACKLFGADGFMSPVKFTDSYPAKESLSKCLVLPERHGIRIDRETGIAAPGAKFDYETVPKGTEFEIEIACDNLNDGQFGLFLLLLDSFSKHGRIGHSASRGLGKMRIVIEKGADIKSAKDFLSGELPWKEYKQLFDKYTKGGLDGLGA